MAWKYEQTKRDLKSQEKYLLPVKTVGSVPINISLVYPNTYSIGMSNLGFHAIYYQINSRNDALCHRSFLSLNSEKKIDLRTLEADKSLSEYDMVGFSVSFEMDYINIIRALELAGIPILSKERKGPLVMAGGPAVTFNPEPLSPFVDFFVIGEGEEVINEVMDIYVEVKHKNKREILEALAQIKGVYVPDFFNFVLGKDDKIENIHSIEGMPKYISKRWVRDLDRFNTESVILTPNTEFGNMFLLEISRGCGRNCRFCMAGYCYRVPRHRSPERILERAKFGSNRMEKVGLVGAAISDYPFIDELATNLIKNSIKISVSSLRADSVKESLMEALAFSGHKTLTIALDASSSRLRRVINKGIDEDDIIKSIKLAHKHGIENVKLYYIIGLPGETGEDIKEMITFVTFLKDYMKGLGNKLGNLTISVNPFIPKPFTPLQWFGMESVKTLNMKIRLLKKELKPKGIKLIYESPRLSQIQSALARGDRQTGSLLYAIYKNGATGSAYRNTKINNKDIGYYAHRCFSDKDVLPWDHINIGLEKKYFVSERMRANEGAETARCTDEKCEICKTCKLE